MCKDCGDGITMSENITPKIKTSPSKFNISIDRVTLFNNEGNETNVEYYYGRISLITEESKPFTTIIVSTHGYTIEHVFNTLMRDYYDCREDNE